MRAAPFSLRHAERFALGVLLILSAIPAAAGIARLVELTSGPIVTLANARFVDRPLPVLLHIVSVIPFSVLGALQMLPSFRRRNPIAHRLSGRALVVFGLVAAITGLWMSHFYPWPDGDGFALYVVRMIVGSAMLLAMIAGVVAIGRRDFAGHGRWMVRAYALGMGAGTQVVTHLPWFILYGRPGERPRLILMTLGWAINVAIAEVIIRRGSSART
jgi:uncharacterized membrane protein